MASQKRSIAYPAKLVYQELTQAEVTLVWNLYQAGGNKVLAIKFIRVQYSHGLYEAKMICDAIGAMSRNDALMQDDSGQPL